MTRIDERYGDLLGEQPLPDRRHLIQDLDATYRVSPPAGVRASIAHVLDERATTLARQQGQRGHTAQKRCTRRARLASVAAAVALTLGGITGYLRMQAPAPVSAAAIVRHVIAARPPATPNQVIHETGSLYVNGPFDLPDQKLFTPPMTVTVDQWTQLDATGAISRQVTALTSSTGIVVARGLQVGQRTQIYGALQNAISTETVSHGQNYAWLANPLDITNVPALLAAAQASSTDNLRLVPQQTLDGVVVDVVQLRTLSPDTDTFPHAVGASRDTTQITTMYVDPQTYTLRGVDVSTVQASGVSMLRYSMRVTRFEIAPLVAAPADTFTLDAPAGARYLPPVQPAPQQQATPFSPVMATLLLAHAPAGLQLGELNEDQGGLYTSTSIIYCGSRRCHGQPLNATQFVISFAQTRPPSTHVPPMLATGQLLTLTIAGQPVQAYYMEDATPLGACRLIFQQGTTTVELYSQGLGKTAFFAAVGTLVNAQTHPDLIPKKWGQAGPFGPAR